MKTQISRTDMETLCRYLRDAAQFYKLNATTPKEKDRARLINKLFDKLNKKLYNYDKTRISIKTGSAGWNEPPKR